MSQSFDFVFCFLVICLNTNSADLYKEFEFFVNGLVLPLGAVWPNQMYKTKNQTSSNFLGFYFIWVFVFWYFLVGNVTHSPSSHFFITKLLNNIKNFFRRGALTKL